MLRRLVPSAATFVLGTGSLFAVDIWIGWTESSERVADWAVFKSLIFPFSTLAMMGIDQIIVREPSKLSLILTKSVTLTALLAGLMSLGAWCVGAYHNGFQLFLATALLGMSGLYFGIFRANCKFSMAHVARDGWKFLLLTGVLVASFTTGTHPQAIMITSCLGTVALSVVWWRRCSVEGMIEQHNEVTDFKSALRISWPFCLAAFSLSIASYGEIVLLKLLNADHEISQYFWALILYSYPAVFANTYLVSLLGTFIRQNAKISANIFINRRVSFMPLIMAVPVAVFTFGYIVEAVIFPEKETPLYLAVLISCVAGVRFTYTFITSFIGALGCGDEIKRISLIYFCLAMTVPFACVPIYLLTESAALSVSLSSMLHWLARGTVGWNLTARLAHRAVRGLPVVASSLR